MIYTYCKVLHTGFLGLKPYAAESQSNVVSATLSCVTWAVFVIFPGMTNSSQSSEEKDK